ncbi:hypothetical protein [Legionella sp. W05-934-2]|uniref:hypothetical protein n=1 Tax=Legionella sp. W05-934-2 TaxID=1198649 RepID=UPI0034632C41
MSGKKIIISLDADGCVFNPLFFTSKLELSALFIKQEIERLIKESPSSVNKIETLEGELNSIESILGRKIHQQDTIDKKLDNPQVIADIIIQANDALINKICDRLSQGQYDEVIFLDGSLRQSLAQDWKNASVQDIPQLVSLSICKAVEIIQDEVQRRHLQQHGNSTTKFSIDKTTLSAAHPLRPRDDKMNKYANTVFDDMSRFMSYNEQGELVSKVGTDSYQYTNNNDRNRIYSKFPGYVADTTKGSILYYQTHRCASKFSSDKIDFWFVDDSVRVLNCLKDFGHEMYPHNVTLELIHHAAETVGNQYVMFVTPYATINGSSVIDKNYKENLQGLYDHSESEGLEKYRKDLYYQDASSDVTSTLNKNSFLNKRKTDKSKQPAKQEMDEPHQLSEKNYCQ